MVGSAVFGQMFDRLGWTACVAGVAASLAMAAVLTTQLKLPSTQRRDADDAGKRLIDHSDLFTTVRSPFVTKADRST